MYRNIGLLFLLASAATLCEAAHPLLTDDPGTQGQGHHQWEINTDWGRQNDGSSHAGGLTYTYGMRSNVDIFVNVSHSRANSSGLNDASIGIKWRLWESQDASLALKPELLLPTGDENKGFGNGRVNSAFTVIGAYEYGKWKILGNLALASNRHDLATERDSNHALLWRASAAALYAFADRWQVLFDTGLARNPDKSSSTLPVYFLSGLIYSPSQDLDLDAGIKWGLNCDACAAQVKRQAGIGLTWRY